MQENNPRLPATTPDLSAHTPMMQQYRRVTLSRAIGGKRRTVKGLPRTAQLCNAADCLNFYSG